MKALSLTTQVQLIQLESSDEVGCAHTEGDPHGDQGGDVDLVGLVVALPRGQASDGLDLHQNHFSAAFPLSVRHDDSR